MSAPTAYQMLVAKVDAFAARSQSAQGPWLKCMRGCDGGCRTRRTAWTVELDHIRDYRDTLPADERRRIENGASESEVLRGERCVFLSQNGDCQIYPARPIICRTHGPVVRTPDERLSWCELNFDTEDAERVISSLPDDSILNLELVNGMLSLINRDHCAVREGVERAPLESTLDGEH